MLEEPSNTFMIHEDEKGLTNVYKILGKSIQKSILSYQLFVQTAFIFQRK